MSIQSSDLVHAENYIERKIGSVDHHGEVSIPHSAVRCIVNHIAVHGTEQDRGRVQEVREELGCYGFGMMTMKPAEARRLVDISRKTIAKPPVRVVLSSSDDNDLWSNHHTPTEPN